MTHTVIALNEMVLNISDFICIVLPVDILIGSLFCVGLCVRSGLSLVAYISCWLLFLVLCEGLSGWGQGLGRCWRFGCNSGLFCIGSIGTVEHGTTHKHSHK